MTAYSIAELLAEKTRALSERCRPRDLYDVINIYRHPDLVGDPEPVHTMLSAKCAHAGILCLTQPPYTGHHFGMSSIKSGRTCSTISYRTYHR